VYDITSFIKSHPGGDVIGLAAGRDATVLFETYHPTGAPVKVLAKYAIGTLKSQDQSASYYSWESPFYDTLRQRVVARLKELGKSRRGSVEIWLKAIFLLSGFWLALVAMIISPLPLAIVASVIMGAFAAFIGTCIQHDGNHGAFSTSNGLNTLAGWTLDMIGASAFTWEIQHMLGHHPYTNLLDIRDERSKTDPAVRTGKSVVDEESDPDVFSSFPLLRMHPAHKRKWFHRFQHMYAPVLFAFMTMAKVFQQDWEVIGLRRLYHIDASCRYSSWHNRARFYGMKALSLLYMLALPCLSHGISGGLLLFVVGHLACGELLATMFIVNHVIEGVAYAHKSCGGAQAAGNAPSAAPATNDGTTPMSSIKPTKTSPPLNDWAAVQCQTSVNWAAGSWFWNHFSGGLSHQIEHHLFPSICHTNYVHIHPIVKQTCAEFGVPYQNVPSLYSAYWKMIAHLRALGSHDSHESWGKLM